MSFWDNNKETFKSAGKATAVGIGKGSKLVAKSGYKTYKNYDAKRKGQTPSEPGAEEKLAPIGQPINTVDVKSLPLPPKRVAPAYEVPAFGEPSKYAGVQQTYQQGQGQPQGQNYAPRGHFPHGQVQQPGQFSQQGQQIQPQTYAPQSQPQQTQFPPQPQFTPPQAQLPEDPMNSPVAPPAYSAGQAPPPPPRQTSFQEPAQSPGPVVNQQIPQRIQPATPNAAANLGSQPQPLTVETPAASYSLLQNPSYSLQLQGQPSSQPSYSQPLSQPVQATNSQRQNGQIQAAPPYTQPAVAANFLGSNLHQPTNVVPEEQPEQKPKRPLPDPTLFAPPPVRRDRPVTALVTSKRPSHAPSQPPISPTFSGSSNKSLSNPPPPPARTQPLPAVSFPPPPPPSYRAALSPQSSSQPAIASNSPSYSQHVAKDGPQEANLGSEETITQPVKPPKPSKKPAHLTNQSTADSAVNPTQTAVDPMQAGIIGELAARNDRRHDGAENKVPTSENVTPIKTVPEKRAKPEIKAKTEKPPSKPKPEIKAKPELKPKPAIEQRPEIKPEPATEPKLEIREDTSVNNTASKILHSSTVSELEARFKKFAIPAVSDDSDSTTRKPPVVKPKPTLPQKPNLLKTHTGNVTPPPAPPSRNGSRASMSPASSVASTPPPPPPPRTYKREKAAIPFPQRSVSEPPKLDLELSSGWFMNTTGPLELPKALTGLNYTTSYSYSLFGGSSQLTRTVSIRLPDLAIVLYDIKWNDKDSSSAHVEISRFLSSPLQAPISTNELIQANQQFGEHIAAWTEHNMGNKVATGECWDVAQKALQKGCGNHAFVSTYYHHGFPILTATGSPSGPSYSASPLDEIRRGDILQFKSCTFTSSAGTQIVGDPDHTSVVLEVASGVIHVGEQNVNGKRYVVRGKYVVENLKKGTLTVYRSMPRAWGGDL